MSLNFDAKWRVFPALLIISLGLTGCSELLFRQTCVGLAKDMRYCLAPLPHDFAPAADKPLIKPTAKPADISSQQTESKTGVSSPQSFSQKVSIKVGDKSHELLTQLELENERMTLVGLAPLGQALFTLVYDGNTLSSEQSVLLGDNFKAEYLMAMMQLIYWPEQSIRAHLEGGHLVTGLCDTIGGNQGDTLEGTRVNTIPCRQIYSQDTLISKSGQQTHVVQIRYQQNIGDALWQAHISLTMPQAKFELEIEPI
ncbi:MULTISPECIES: DUF3261 domain-containing protein [unclassified Shewanella]|uniref:DUF3261 domain-containing protein n=1 Tax=Shewanella TaxID=22 RepID=UPI0021D95825|nr:MULTISPECIES: DUF3261 domain-containing protein [unclassified Shewanella]MCU8056104.1 DUF3261 domain-containing protein [Shewanella sp. SM35]MCU8065038.1 DUF3261 domain-containing protein [Shewanella sp. SM34]MCU8075134.1 DUF3261 domain-containing protein [Shewanella sp. SM29]